MELEHAQRMAEELIAEHLPVRTDVYGLPIRWRFAWLNAYRKHGQCCYGPRLIKLSKPCTLANDEAEIRDTILHEIAHAIAGPGHGHGPVWQCVAAGLGARPEACTRTAKAPAGRYHARCGVCSHDHQAYRRRTRSVLCATTEACKRADASQRRLVFVQRSV